MDTLLSSCAKCWNSRMTPRRRARAPRTSAAMTMTTGRHEKDSDGTRGDDQDDEADAMQARLTPRAATSR